MNEIKISKPNGGKHISIAGDINSILTSKNDTKGCYSVVAKSLGTKIADYTDASNTQS